MHIISSVFEKLANKVEVFWPTRAHQLWQALCARFSDMIFHNPAKGEIIVAASTLVWGVWLTHSTESFRIPAYALLAEIASEGTWATALVVIGLTQLSILLTGRPPLRRICAVLMVALWTFLGLAFTLHPQPLAIEIGLLCLVQAVSSAWTFFQIGWLNPQRR